MSGCPGAPRALLLRQLLQASTRNKSLSCTAAVGGARRTATVLTGGGGTPMEPINPQFSQYYCHPVAAPFSMANTTKTTGATAASNVALCFSTSATAASQIASESSSNNSINELDSTKMQSTGNSHHQNNLPPVPDLIRDIHLAVKYNQGNTRQVASQRRHRRDYYWNVDLCRSAADSYEKYLVAMAEGPNSNISEDDRNALLNTSTLDCALGVLLKCQLTPPKLSRRVRLWEKVVGALRENGTPVDVTERLTLRLLEVNAKAGNVGRVMSLLEYRTSQQYAPHAKEYIYAITAVEVAGWYLRKNRNVYLGDRRQPLVDNPTRWLDAILLNMHDRNVPLTSHLAVRMLDTYASRGRSGKAVHYFYSVHRTPVDKLEEDEFDFYDDDDYDELAGVEENYEDYPFDKSTFGEQEEQGGDDASSSSASSDPEQQPPERSYKVRIKLKPPPRYHKIPTEVRGKLLKPRVPRPSKTSDTNNYKKKKRHSQVKSGILKIDRESEPDWSLPLTAAFSFADSLSYGACGHPPLELNLVCYNVLIKTCVYRGALWRAMHLLDTTMPAQGITPDVRSYDTLLSGLARVGDVAMMRDYYQQMMVQNITPSYYTVQCVVDGLLNLGDVAGAITVIQDFFNQHSILPPVKTQLKVLEFALGLDMLYEAKRHIYFIQQLWKWEPHSKYDTKEFIYYMKTYQRDRRISKEALQQLFAYFGATLDESDFF